MEASFTIGAGGLEDFDAVLAIDSATEALYASAGVRFELTDAHPFVVHERARWTAKTRAGGLLLARDPSGEILGFAITGALDGRPYLDQISVHPKAGRQGIGRALVRACVERVRSAGGRELWLNTYGHLAWNRPFYESEGFVLVPEPEWAEQMRATIEEQRRSLPLPEQRVVMRRAID